MRRPSLHLHLHLNFRRRTAATAGAALALAILAAGCSSPSTPSTVTVPKGGFANDKADPAVHQWFKAHLPAVTALGTLTTLGTASPPNYSALSAECVSFGDTVAAAKKLPPIPDAGAEILWKDALSQLNAAVVNCSNGAIHMSSSLITAASSDLSLGHSTLATLVFGPPSTTTTT